jgi:orotidine-5'-phosphate decarboxylase
MSVEKYNARAEAVNSLVCVGLDPQIDALPERYRDEGTPQFAWNRDVIDATHPYVAAYKPNIAFYEERGVDGLRELQLTIAYLRERHPDIFTICDAKRADIGHTNEAYAAAIFDLMGFDAVTLHPYLGREALAPFLERRDKVSLILCRTSNPGAGDLQDLLVEGRPLWQVVAEKVTTEWNLYGNLMMVVGATYPGEMRRIREVAGDLTFLVPGVGAQGGQVQAVVEAGLNSHNMGLIISSSRGVISAPDPGEAARALRDEINSYRQAHALNIS